MYVKVKVITESKKESVIIKGENITVNVKEKASMGEANRRVIAIISSIFPKKKIKLVKGQRSKSKIFFIDD